MRDCEHLLKGKTLGWAPDTLTLVTSELHGILLFKEEERTAEEFGVRLYGSWKPGVAAATSCLENLIGPLRIQLAEGLCVSSQYSVSR